MYIACDLTVQLLKYNHVNLGLSSITVVMRERL